MSLKGTRSHAREIIKAEELINVLQDSVLGDNPTPLNQNQINTIKVLLAKAIPDLKAIEHTGEIDQNITKTHKVSFK